MPINILCDLLINYATKLILPMHRRLSLVFLPLLYAPISLASEAAWNCEQNKDSKEWLCVGDEKPTAKTDESEASDYSLPTKKIPPTLAEPAEPVEDEGLQPAVPATVRRTKPADLPVATESTLPVSPPQPEPDKSDDMPVIAKEPQPVESEPVRSKQPVDSPAILEASKPAKPAETEDTEDSEQAENDDSSQSASTTTPASNRDTQASSVNTKSPGWNCDSKDTEENWNCQLFGADPRGQARPVRVVSSSDSHALRLLDPAFTDGEEQTFETLTSKLPYDPWEICDVVEKKDKPAFVPKKGLRDTSPLELTSDFAQVFDNEIGHYLGNVEISRADQHSLSHIANYDKVSGALDLNGDVYYNEDELALYGRSASIKLNSDQAKLREALFISPGGHLRGSSKVVYRDSKTFSRYKDVAYTSCRPGNQDWVLHASELKLNDETGKGAVKNAWVEFKGVPVFYTPYLSFPKDNRRLTGFLTPSLHYTQQAGVGIYTPYYWNIAPNYDATFIPRYLTNRGMLLGGDFRYMTEMTGGDVKFEYLPNDIQLHKSRYLGAITNHSAFTPNITSNLDLNYVSDKNYFNQLGNALSLPNFSYLRSSADVNYVREGVSLTARADNYQSVNPNQTVLPYRRLPQVNLNLNHSFKSVPMETAMESESVYFQHGSNVNGQRFNVKPSVSFPLQTAGGGAFVTPKLSFQYTQYFLSKETPGTPKDISRTLPIASLDSGLFLEKELNLGGSPMVHTLEPRLFYLYIPYKKQSNIPLFDTAQYDFVFNSLFRENRFAGTDRIQDANQFSVALTSRLVDSSTGRERLKVNIGDIFYLQHRDESFDLLFPKAKQRWVSPIIGELSSELTDHISVETGMQWDPETSDVTRGKAAIHFVNQPNEIINAGYYYRKNPQIPDRLDDIIQSDVSVHWPIYDDWSVVGRWQYSLLYNRTQEGFFGLEKENCCWRFRVIGRQYISSLVNTSPFLSPGINQAIAEGKAQTGVFFQVELKGLTAIGERLDDFFERNIYGYRKP
jgi:LPS-assembly protein